MVGTTYRMRHARYPALLPRRRGREEPHGRQHLGGQRARARQRVRGAARPAEDREPIYPQVRRECAHIARPIGHAVPGVERREAEAWPLGRDDAQVLAVDDLEDSVGLPRCFFLLGDEVLRKVFWFGYEFFFLSFFFWMIGKPTGFPPCSRHYSVEFRGGGGKKRRIIIEFRLGKHIPTHSPRAATMGIRGRRRGVSPSASRTRRTPTPDRLGA